MEIEYGPFQRQIQLAEDIDVASASASYERGLLTITMPIAERPARPQPVTIVVQRIG